MTPEARPDAVCAVVVTYFPDEQVTGNLLAMARQAGRLVIVDNGSQQIAQQRLEAWVREHSRAELLALPSNAGLAAALNLGIEHAAHLGFDYVVTFDQDSLPAPGMVTLLCEALNQDPEPEKVAAVGPTIVDRNAAVESYRWLAPHRRLPFLFRRVAAGDGFLDDVTFVITSGSLMPLAPYRTLGGFREGLFIDYVDHEYCLRARSAGYRILVAGRAQLLHALGAKRELKVGRYSVRPTFHGADRLYYIYRNRIPLILRHGLRQPHWLTFDIMATTHNLLRVALFENDRRRKLLAILQGTWHGLLGREGQRPEERKP